MLKYQCINCKTTWGNLDSEDPIMSHGVCFNCLKIKLTPIYRNRQLREGNPDCFGRAINYCDQQTCCYRETCLK